MLTQAQFQTGESCPLPVADNLPPTSEEWEQVRILVIGSANGVTRVIRTLYVLGFAQIHEWSPLVSAPNSGDVMSILTRRMARESHT